ncbi:hypothetical protein RQP53_05985 [Paucibacter sp. APW11]|uniref:VCBS repeat-containing protein n=1 Tax=Roseateles aquae TaxID=3077235 RepID=A0ABU3P937_9BURK|nr:hypothetical protein [Paucibacter sp. APW11]MDT8998812.1 hypothetical protein [Paucibacter sp. APW11]
MFLSRSLAGRLLLTALVAVGIGASAAELTPPGLILRQGEWRGDVGSFSVPEALVTVPASRWPMDAWVVLMIDTQAATLSIRPLVEGEARQLLKPVLSQVLIAQKAADADWANYSPIEPGTDLFVRVPGLRWKPGTVALHRFRNGTPVLVPELGHRIQLQLGSLPYAFTVQNGFRTADGRPYGSGTQFKLEIEGQVYEYDLGGYGWEVSIQALGDFDGDGRPDFLFAVGGSNSSHDALVLSSQARPGRNPPTAYLTAMGC